MSERRCTIAACRRRQHARTWCKKHYQRWHDFGRPELPTESGCQVTVWDIHASVHDLRWSHKPCGEPLATDRLCAKHEADRVRLGGVV